MSDSVTILSSVVSGLIGGGLGFYLSSNKLKTESDKYVRLYWQELGDVRDEEEILLRRLFKELDEPYRKGYTGQNEIDWEYFRQIQISIGSSMPFNMNRLLNRMKLSHESIEFNMRERVIDLGSRGYHCKKELVLASLMSVCNLLYLLNKALEEKERFRIKGTVAPEHVVKAIFTKYSLDAKHREQLLIFASNIKNN
jgi:hypothetical protein